MCIKRYLHNRQWAKVAFNNLCNNLCKIIVSSSFWHYVLYGSRFVFVTGGYQVRHQQFLPYKTKHKNNNSHYQKLNLQLSCCSTTSTSGSRNVFPTISLKTVLCNTEWPLCVTVRRSVVAFNKCLNKRFSITCSKKLTSTASPSKRIHKVLVEYGSFAHMFMMCSSMESNQYTVITL